MTQFAYIYYEVSSLFSASLFEENVVNLLDVMGSSSCFQPRFLITTSLSFHYKENGVNLPLILRKGARFQPRFFLENGVNLVTISFLYYEIPASSTLLKAIVL